MCVILHDRYSILQLDKIKQICRLLNKVIKYSIMGEIRDTLLKSLKDNPEILKKLEMKESDEKTRALLRLILKEIQNDPEYSGINH
jgi:transcriptional regulator of NAD metabolism